MDDIDDEDNYTKQHITKTIALCQFPNLLSVKIKNTKIHNLQFIRFLDAPNLKHLDISANQISNFKPLRNSSLKGLTNIVINSNPVQQILLERMFLCGNVQTFAIQSKGDDRTFSDMSNLAKLEPKFINIIELWGERRIRQQKIVKVLKHKFSKKNHNLNRIESVAIITNHLSNW